MATYAQNAATRERAARRAAQDQHLRRQHALFDAQTAEATDKRGNHKTMKYERPSFAVVTASDAYRTGWDNIFGHKTGSIGNESESEQSSSEPTAAPVCPIGA